MPMLYRYCGCFISIARPGELDGQSERRRDGNRVRNEEVTFRARARAPPPP